MTHNKSHSRRELQQEMNQALDGREAGDARSQLTRRLAKSPDEVLWDRMQKVDRLLTSEPMIQAPNSFALNVMGAISAGKMPQPVAHRTDLRAVIGMLVAVALVLPLVLLTLLFIHQLVIDSVLRDTLIAQLSHILNSGLQAITTMFQGMINGGTLVMLSLFTSLGLTLFTLNGMNRYFTTRRQQVVYRIPVQVA